MRSMVIILLDSSNEIPLSFFGQYNIGSPSVNMFDYFTHQTFVMRFPYPALENQYINRPVMLLLDLRENILNAL